MVTAPERGIAVEAGALNPLLKPHQAAIVHWALRKGNAAIFAASDSSIEVFKNVP